MLASANKLPSNLILALSMLCLVQGVKAEAASGAVVWWLMFTMIAVAGGTGYMVYLVYVQKKPLGKNHPYFEAEVDPAAMRKKSEKELKREEEAKTRNERMRRDDQMRQGQNRPVKREEPRKMPVASPEDVIVD
jgi:hypothetical protein